MPRRPATFTQADVRRALRAAKQAGAKSAELRLGDGTSIVVNLKGTAPTIDPASEVDNWFAKNARAS